MLGARVSGLRRKQRYFVAEFGEPFNAFESHPFPGSVPGRRQWVRYRSEDCNPNLSLPSPGGLVRPWGHFTRL
jgi:hypothetical protein